MKTDKNTKIIINLESVLKGALPPRFDYDFFHGMICFINTCLIVATYIITEFIVQATGDNLITQLNAYIAGDLNIDVKTELLVVEQLEVIRKNTFSFANRIDLEYQYDLLNYVYSYYTSEYQKPTDAIELARYNEVFELVEQKYLIYKEKFDAIPHFCDELYKRED